MVYIFVKLAFIKQLESSSSNFNIHYIPVVFKEPNIESVWSRRFERRHLIEGLKVLFFCKGFGKLYVHSLGNFGFHFIQTFLNNQVGGLKEENNSLQIVFKNTKDLCWGGDQIVVTIKNRQDLIFRSSSVSTGIEVLRILITQIIPVPFCCFQRRSSISRISSIS